jgi:predicted transcriptional regulator of viral defense system
MSTMERYGDAVWAACLDVARDDNGNYKAYFTVGEVMRSAGVSRGTARKYLDILYENGAIGRLKTDSLSLYRLIVSFEDQ